MTTPIAHAWLVEPLLQLDGVIHKRMFGAFSIYLDGKLVLVTAEGDEPWNGLLFPVEKDRQSVVLEAFPQLTRHSVLPKWLYLPTSRDDFEPLAKELIELIRYRDPRFGTIPKPRSERKKKPPLPCPESTHGAPKGIVRSRHSVEQKALPDGRPPYLA
ncbi:MAG: hypothetical protein SFY80_04670 [Verrucomicrobiota bacterium]|nr:hypothetical protein [Verrucomicrobiota bacterium]